MFHVEDTHLKICSEDQNFIFMTILCWQNLPLQFAIDFFCLLTSRRARVEVHNLTQLSAYDWSNGFNYAITIIMQKTGSILNTGKDFMSILHGVAVI